ncbi:tetratricopeptide repeat protein [Winogradskyella marincola]|uniref:Tetratricopeptide repeat protein n=1 Tax=Winogradskyella marincola TaxID=3037795 RepID=A0ABT6G269_9FLAO|nr:tetratricopeptide repeat protein [Winogradskyella sp. YYF002]MDG4716139.1 tetratricopeptide repeat protein [Winogradskyella sp. YYF002]
MFTNSYFKTLFLLVVAFSINAQETIATKETELFSLKAELENAIKEDNRTSIGITNIKLADFFYRISLYKEATTYYQNYLELHLPKDSSFIKVQNQLALINLELKQYGLAESHASLALRTSEYINYKKGEATSNALLGSVAEKQSNYNDALKFQKKSLALFSFLKDSTGIAITNENIGSIYEDLEQYQKALNYFNVAQSFSKNSPWDLKINIINNIGDINRKTKKYIEAIGYTEQALELAKTSNNQSQLVSALKDLSRTYADMGNFSKAYEYLNNQNIANEEELIQNNNEIVSALQILHDVKEKENEVQLLNKQNEINKVQQSIILIIASALTLGLCALFLYWKKRKKHEKHILEYQQQLLQADLDKKAAKEIALNREIDIKVSALTNYSLHIAHKNKMLSDISKTLSKLKDRNSALVSKKLKDIVKDIESDLENNNEWTELMSYFGQIHPSFFSKLKNDAKEKLSSSEMRLCMLLRLNLSSKEIGGILRITSDSVRIARYRLRKKLPLESKDDLQAYLLNL